MAKKKLHHNVQCAQVFRFTPVLLPSGFSSSRLFGVDDDQHEGTESEGSEVTGQAQAFPSYAATAALPASGPISTTLTG